MEGKHTTVTLPGFNPISIKGGQPGKNEIPTSGGAGWSGGGSSQGGEGGSNGGDGEDAEYDTYNLSGGKGTGEVLPIISDQIQLSPGRGRVSHSWSGGGGGGVMVNGEGPNRGQPWEFPRSGSKAIDGERKKEKRKTERW